MGQIYKIPRGIPDRVLINRIYPSNKLYNGRVLMVSAFLYTIPVVYPNCSAISKIASFSLIFIENQYVFWPSPIVVSRNETENNRIIGRLCTCNFPL